MTLINRVIMIGGRINYIPISIHRRRGNVNKSWWTISVNEEVNCFSLAVNNRWLINDEGWGLHLINNNPKVLGESPAGKDLKIAKFVNNNNNFIWHGYPADYQCKPQDCPSANILSNWVQQGIIDKTQMKRIRGGQDCGL